MRDPETDKKTHFSLLSPDDDDSLFTLSDNTENDLSVSFLAESVSGNSTEYEIIRKILLNMPMSRRTIEYRSDICADLRSSPELCEELHEIFDAMRFYVNDRPNTLDKNSTIWELFMRLRALDSYVGSVRRIIKAIDGHEFRSEGMKKFAAYMNDIYSDSGFDELAEDIAEVGDDISSIRSLTLGVNLDRDLFPEEVGILSLNRFWFGEQGLLKRFIKYHRKDQINDKKIMPFNMEVHEDGLDTIEKRINRNAPKHNRPYDSPLMNNLNSIIERMLPSVTGKLRKVLDRYVDVSLSAFTALADEFLFYLRFISLEKELSDLGMPCCQGECSDKDTFMTDFYNIRLAICRLRGTVTDDIVCNDIEFTDDTAVQILTGPNRGGKTILTQGIGLAFLMYQSGLFVPAASAKIRPCDGIYTHFPAEEERTVALGRLGEEAERFREICRTAGRDSLILFNESFATTSHTESLYIAEDVLKYLCCTGSRTCFNTHMHELAENADAISSVPGAVCRAVSVVMENRDGERTYKISFKKPDGKSYAHEIACKYGITFEQLINKQSADRKEE
ncbi:MAG: hypothetical protein J5501_03625 [Ruminococcus sp.]|nr:hypothetical protein [Ruminococcus sp.]